MTLLSDRETSTPIYPPEPVKAVPVRHYGQWVSAAITIAVVAVLAWTVMTNPRIQWEIVQDYLFRKEVLDGIVVTLKLTVLAMVLGVLGGTVLAVMRLSDNPVLRAISWAYIWFFRGTPVLVQLVLWFNLGLIFPNLGFGPLSWETNELIGTFTAALLALALNEAAYMAEIVRGGILSVDSGQSEAAQALGMNGSLTMRRIVLPQAMRVIVPPTGNEVITMLKTTALVSVIGATDLFTQASFYGAKNFAVFEMFIVASFWYLVMTSLLTLVQSRLEKKFAQSTTFAASRRSSRLRRRLPSLFNRGAGNAGGAR